MVGELTGPHLSTRSHKVSHGHVDLTNVVVFAFAVSVNNTEFKVLDLFEVVGDREAGCEVWVQRVLDLLGLAQLDPLSVSLLKEEALGVRLGERVQISELAPGHKQGDLHAELICG